MKVKKLFILFLILTAALLSLPACTDQDEQNPDLDSHLWGLIEAEKRGEAEEFVRQGNIELVDGKVKVIIECEPGQVEVAMEAVTKTGATQVKSGRDLIRAFVPITSLNSLTEAPGVKFIRQPVYAESE